MSANDAQAHEALLRKYNPDNQPWWQIPDDGYLYDHLAEHLLGVGRQDELYHLLTDSPEWMRVKFIACEGHESYRRDLETARRAYAEPTDLNQFTRLICLSAAGFSAQTHLNALRHILAPMVWLGRTEEAIVVARWMEANEDNDHGLQTIAKTLVDKGQLDQAYELIGSITENFSRALATAKLAEGYAQQGDLDRALSLTGDIHEPGLRGIPLATVAPILTNEEHISRAIQLAFTIDRPWFRARALCRIAAALFGTDHRLAPALIAEVKNILDNLEADGEDSASLISIRSHLAIAIAAKDKPQALVQFEQLIAAARSIEDARNRLWALTEVTKSLILVEQSRANEVLAEIIRSIQQDEIHPTIFTHYLDMLAEDLISIGQVDFALKWARDYHRERAVAKIAEQGDVDRALELALKINDDRKGIGYYDTLAQIAAAIGRQGDPRATTFFEEVCAYPRGLDDFNAHPLSAIAVRLAQEGLIEQASELVRLNNIGKYEHTVDEGTLSYWQRAIAVGLAEDDQIDAALNIARSLPTDSADRIIALSEIASKAVRIKQLKRAQDIAEYMDKDTRHYDQTLSVIACELAGRGHISEAIRMMLFLKKKVQQTVLPSLEDEINLIAQLFGEAAVDVKTQLMDDPDRETHQRRYSAQMSVMVAEAYAKASIAIAEALVGKGEFEPALKLARSLEHAEFRAMALIVIAEQHISPDDATQLLEEALDNARNMVREFGDQLPVWYSLVAAHVHRNQLDEALTIARAMQDEAYQSVLLGHIAVHLFDQGDPRATDILAEAVDLALSLEEHWRRISPLEKTAITLADHTHFRPAFLTADTIDENHLTRAKTLEAVAVQMLQHHQFAMALPVLDLLRADRFLQTLAKGKLPMTVILKTMRIISWYRPDWRRIYEVINLEQGV